MTIVEHRMAYERANRMLQLAFAYDFCEDIILKLMRAMAERKMELEQAEREWA